MGDVVVIKVGPVGGPYYSIHYWDEGGHINVRQIFIFHGDFIHSIQMAYDDGEKITMLERHGGTGDNFSVVNLSESEPLIEISGYYGRIDFGSVSIRSLKFTTSLDVYGPFGVEKGTPFAFKMGPGAFGGLHGVASASDLLSIGVYVKTLATHYEGTGERLSMISLAN